MNFIKKVLERLEFEPMEVSCSRCDGSGWIMDNKGEQTECVDCCATGKITEMKVKDINSALTSIASEIEGMRKEAITPSSYDNRDEYEESLFVNSYNQAIDEVVRKIRGQI